MKWIVAYLGCALAFGVLDALWLRWAGPNFYRPRLGDILAESFHAAPAIAFYLIYIAGMVWFAVHPGMVDGIGAAALNGALLGALAYATYDLTSQAVLKQWSTTVTVADIAWGAFATAVAAAAGTWAVEKFA
ncbi:DUF2177 family protein [Pseudoblastomonas halimionae]|uniref:DUF2177 family protein n=1 Tax=Alteriqipengyuania halimionae TaxID=1926630 RepID=A0A6I4U5Y5_9SPHN|nr:DUF2177 family protein [Alteriqipengyuania halimionae]MXP09677.1 DUF2177 family protein [Alteriqipengyuania halimionae]